MNILDVINQSISDRGIPISELSRRIGMNDELLRRSLAGTRHLRATEFVNLCHEMSLDMDDFAACVKTNKS